MLALEIFEGSTNGKVWQTHCLKGLGEAEACLLTQGSLKPGEDLRQESKAVLNMLSAQQPHW